MSQNHAVCWKEDSCASCETHEAFDKKTCPVLVAIVTKCCSKHGYNQTQVLEKRIDSHRQKSSSHPRVLWVGTQTQPQSLPVHGLRWRCVHASTAGPIQQCPSHVSCSTLGKSEASFARAICEAGGEGIRTGVAYRGHPLKAITCFPD